jgi:secreted trypsin-like serine protease
MTTTGVSQTATTSTQARVTTTNTLRITTTSSWLQTITITRSSQTATMTTTRFSPQTATTTIAPPKKETYECNRSLDECGCSLANVVLSDDNQQLSSTNTTGEDAFPYSWSMIVSIRVNSTKHMCTGTILSDSFILTAAHCVSSQSNSTKIMVAAGIHSLSQYVTSIRRVDQVYIHENYTSQTSHLHDIAVLHLEQPLDLKTQPMFSEICLSDTKSFDSPGASLLVSVGWKHSPVAENEDSIIQQVAVKSITSPNSTCFNYIYYDLYQFCAGLMTNDTGNFSKDYQVSEH